MADVGRIALTKLQIRAIEIALYREADAINRLLHDDRIPYGKMALGPDGRPA